MEFRTEPVATVAATDGNWRGWILGSLAAAVLLLLVYQWSLSWRIEHLESFLSVPAKRAAMTT
jgi:hypothetical protein